MKEFIIEIIKSEYCIIGLSDVNWKLGWSSRRRILTGIALKKWDVLFSSGPLSIWNRDQNEWKAATMLNSFPVEDNVIVDIPGKLLSDWPNHNYLSMIILKCYSFLFLYKLKKKKKIVICFHPKFAKLIQLIDPDLLIYYVYDDLSNSQGWCPDLEQKENNILDKCDLILGFSEQMLTRIKSKTKKPIFPLPLGVDMHLFLASNNIQAPEDLSIIPLPRIGYTGHINQKIDWELVYFLAKERSRCHWCFIGKETGVTNGSFSGDKDSYLWWKRCCELPNVHYLGFREHNLIPQYVNHMSLNIMPYQLNGGWWEFGYPLKMHEYLATGKPVISSDLAAVREFESVIDIAKTREEWLDALDRAIKQNGKGTLDERINIAKKNDWKMRVDKLEQYLLDLVQQKRL